MKNVKRKMTKKECVVKRKKVKKKIPSRGNSKPSWEALDIPGVKKVKPKK